MQWAGASTAPALPASPAIVMLLQYKPHATVTLTPYQNARRRPPSRPASSETTWILDMFSLIHSRLNVKLSLSLAITLCIVMAGLSTLYFTAVDRLMGEQEARAQLYRVLNRDMRDEVFRLQARLVDIPDRLQTDPIPVLQAWALQQPGTTVRRYEGRDQIIGRFADRRQRRDLQQPNRVVMTGGADDPGVAYGLFVGDTFADAVEELVLPGADPAQLAARVDAVMSAGTSLQALQTKVSELRSVLVDDALSAETTRNALLGQVETIAAMERSVEASKRDSGRLIIAMTIGAILLANLMVWIVTRRMITGALSDLAHAARAIANGEHATVDHTHRTDEIGALAKGVSRFKQALVEVHTLKEQQEHERAAREAALATRLRALNDAVEQGMGARVAVVTNSASELGGIASALDGLAGGTMLRAGESTELAGRSARFAEVVMTTTQILHTAAQEIAADVQAQRALTQQVAAEAEQVSTLMSGLTTTASEIDGVVHLIERIAKQTKLLSLNATIEAARAGPAGAGFAVVAGEVNTLSSETADATHRIARQIASFRNGVASAETAAATIQDRVQAVNEGMQRAANGVTELSQKTAAITDGVAKASANARQVADVNMQVDASARETGTMSAQVSDLAVRIGAAVEDMRAHLRSILADASGETAPDAPLSVRTVHDLARTPPLCPLQPHYAIAAE